jgi:hypothetical protein
MILFVSVRNLLMRYNDMAEVSDFDVHLLLFGDIGR